jgi:hypothetical protein
MLADLLCPLSGQRLDMAGFPETSVYIYQTACCHIPQDNSHLSNKFVLNIVLLMFFKAMAIGSIQNARVHRVRVDTLCPPRKIEGPHSCYRFSLLEWKSSNAVVIIKIYAWVIEFVQ